MKKAIFTITIFFSCLNHSFSQQEISLFLGTSFFHGDVGYNSLQFGNIDKLFLNSKPAWGLSFRNNFNERFSINLSFKKGVISAYDNQSEDLFLVNRNLDFQSKYLNYQQVLNLIFHTTKLDLTDLIKHCMFSLVSVGLNLTHKDYLKITLGLIYNHLELKGKVV